ncbi:MAG: fumarylacetoacetate hydrolase family protein [Actinomycetota bacterium]
MSSTSGETIERIADDLRAAADGDPMPPIADRIRHVADDTGTGAEEVAYAVQQHNVERAVADRGTRVCGRKIGLTSTSVQAQLGVDRPDFGSLFADRCYGDGAQIDASQLIAPRVEAEIALVLKDELDLGQHTLADVIRATDFVLTAIEVVDSRIKDWSIGFLDTVADNASGHSFVLGTVPHHLDGLDLAAVEIAMSIDGDVVSTGHGRDCLGNPLLAAVWLADALSAVGTPLRTGDVVMTGAVSPMAPFAAGQTVEADFGPLGTISVNATD